MSRRKRPVFPGGRTAATPLTLPDAANASGITLPHLERLIKLNQVRTYTKVLDGIPVQHITAKSVGELMHRFREQGRTSYDAAAPATLPQVPDSICVPPAE